MNQRAAMALIGACLVLIFPLALISVGWQAAQQSALIGIAFRTGMLLLVTALAWPQLQQIGRRLSATWVWLVAALALIVAIRPRLIPLALGLGLLAAIIHFGIRFGAEFWGRPRS